MSSAVAEAGPNELWAETVLWYGRKVGKPLNEMPGVWTGIAERSEDVGPLDVAINAHKEENDGIPPFGVRITSPQYLFACIVTPAGGTMAVAGNLTEDSLIEFFKRSDPAEGG